MAEVIPFTGATIADIEPADMLRAAANEKMQQVLILGWTETGSLYAACSSADLPVAMWLVERGRHYFNRMQDDHEAICT